MAARYTLTSQCAAEGRRDNPWNEATALAAKGVRRSWIRATGGFRAAALGVLFAVGTIACGAARKTALEGPPPDPCLNSMNQEEVRTLVTSRGSQKGPDAGYEVAPGDLLVVTVYSYRPAGGDFSSDVRVDDRGYISLPMISPIHVAGRTASEVHHAIVVGLRKAEVLNEPLVSVFLKDYKGHEVVVLGAVARPGMYHLSRGRQTLVDLISMAGGLSEHAGNYVLVRPAPRAASGEGEDVVGRSYTLHTTAVKEAPADPSSGNIPICFDTATGEPDPALLTLEVRGGDLVIVPEAGQAYIEGEVDKPGPYQLSHGMTLTQLISSAGGMTFPADPSRVRLIRQDTPDDTGQWVVDLDRSEDTGGPAVRLSRNDRIVVPYRPARKVVYGVYQFVTAVVRVTIGGAVAIF